MNRKLHYAWIMMGACFVLQAATTGIYLNCSGLYTPQIVKEFAFSNGSFALAVTIRTIATSISMLMCAKMFSRKTFKLIYIISALTCSIAFSSQIFFTRVWQWYISNAVLGFALGFIMTIPLNLMLQNWFKARQGLAMGVAMTGSGIMGMLMNPISSVIIEKSGWRSGIITMAAVSLLLIIPTIVLITKWDPESTGDTRYGAGTTEKSSVSSISYPGLVFTGTLIVVIFYCISQFNQSISIFIDSLGLSVIFAGTMSSVMMAGNTFGKLAIGYFADRIGTMNVFIITTAGIIYSFVIFSFFPTVYLLLPAGLFYGLCMSLASLAPGLVAKELLSGDTRRKVMGKMTSYATLASAVFFPTISYSYDLFGSFKPIYILSIVLSVCVILLMIKIRKETANKN